MTQQETEDEKNARLLLSMFMQAGAQQKAQQQKQSYAACPRCGGSGQIYYQGGGSDHCRQCGAYSSIEQRHVSCDYSLIFVVVETVFEVTMKGEAKTGSIEMFAV